MRVVIVYDSTEERDLEGSVSFVWHVFLKLKEINLPRLPVMSFVEYEDYVTYTPNDLLVEC